ncbi:MAG TPA: hypothetical protein VF669_07400 [Tepidisphaeraceae bacterium]|jgi:hypothetical protein
MACLQYLYRSGASVALLVLLIGVAVPSRAETAKPAGSFLDSIGINTHFGNGIYVGGNAYADRRIDAKLGELGVRHIRDHSWNDTALTLVDNLHTTYGINANLILGETTRSPVQLVNLLQAHPVYEAIEGLNEPDFSNRTYNNLTDDRASNSFPATRAFQNDLYAAVKANPQTSGVTVLSPAMGRSNKSQYLMPINFDVAAMHSYAWASPATAANEPSFGVSQAISDMSQLRGSKPLIATESGYYNEPAANSKAVPELTIGKYTPRLYAEFFNRGVQRTYLYELADQGPDKTVREQNFGLLRYDMTEKPAFIALKNLIDLLEESSFSGSAGSQSVNYTMTSPGSLANVHHTLLQKKDGRFYLLLWQELLGYNSVSKTEINNPPVPVTLTFEASFKTLGTYLPGQSATPTAVQYNANVLNINVPDQMMVIELNNVPEPAAVAIPALAAICLLRSCAPRRPRSLPPLPPPVKHWPSQPNPAEPPCEI